MSKRKSMLLFALSLMGLAACAAPAVPDGQVMPLQTSQTQKANAKANANVSFVKAVETAPGVWRFDVSVTHPDIGWKDYADGWDVLDSDGTVVKPRGGKFTRTLVHPHVGQIPFTRSQNGIKLKGPIITVRAHDIVDGFGGIMVKLDLRTQKGTGYRILHR